jgi:hypothetical protein
VASDDALARVLDGELVMLDVESGTYFGINTVGTRIWELLTAGESVAAARAQLLREFDVDEATLRQDMQALVSQLIDRALLETVSD